jgi:hypothetical protein
MGGGPPVRRGGMDGLDAAGNRDADPRRSHVELGNSQLLVCDRLRDVRHGRPGDDGR